MKERRQRFSIQKKKDDAIMNFVSRQAQEAILDPNLPEAFKDEVIDNAVGTLLRIAERRNVYGAGCRQNRHLKQSQTTHKAK